METYDIPEELGCDAMAPEIEQMGDNIRVNESTDFYTTIQIAGPNGYVINVKIFRSSLGEFQAILDMYGKRIVGSNYSHHMNAVDRVIFILGQLRPNEKWSIVL
jgi:hypothetical protein